MADDLIPVVELLRVSTEAQAREDRAGLPAQHAANVRTCQAYGLQVVETIEVVMSGAKIARSAEMARLLACVSSGRARGIVLAEYSRLFRPDNWDDYQILQRLAEAGAVIYEPGGPTDLDSDHGALSASFKTAFSAYEKRQIRTRTMRGKEEKRRQGKHVAGAFGIPLGFTYSKAAGWQATENLTVVRELFSRFLAGEQNVARLADALGLPRTTARFILTNEVYTGWRVYDERRGRDGQRARRAAEDVIRVRLEGLDPVVTEEEFERVQQVLSHKAACRAPRCSLHDEFLYRGFLVCAVDGLAIYTHYTPVRAGGARHYRYQCRSATPHRRPAGTGRCSTGSMSRERLEPVLDAVIAERLTDPGLFLAAIEASRAGEPRRGHDPSEAALLRLERVRARRQRILEAFIDGDLSREEKDRRIAAADQEIAAAEAALGVFAPAAPETVTEDDVLALAAAFAEWSFLPRPERRRILEAVAPTFSVSRLPGKRGNFQVEGVRFPFFGASGSTDSVNRPRWVA